MRDRSWTPKRRYYRQGNLFDKQLQERNRQANKQAMAEIKSKGLLNNPEGGEK